MKIRKIAFLITFLFLWRGVMAQENSSSLAFSAYTDVYYSYFSNEMEPNALQPFTTVSPRSERFGLNVAQIGLAYDSQFVRANLILHWGDIAKATWSEEYNNVQEANLGFKLANGWWIDAGFFATHIGTESFLPKNDFLSSTAVATYNEPFYQAGAKLTYEGSDDFYTEFWVLNGYNRFLDNNNAKSIGVLFSYNFSENTSLTYTNLLGTESAEGSAVKQYRIYQNLYLNTVLTERLILIVGGDVGTQSNSKLPNMEETAIMYNALTTLRYLFTDKWSVTGRAEVFNDRHGFISGLIPTQNSGMQGLELWGLTLGIEYKPDPNSYIRGEARFLDLDDNAALFSGSYSRHKRWELMVTMGYQLDRVFGF
ncbi:porin [Antarcticibacterium flavum]|uniref:Porin n=1 Tax=Antarcticibacterium flavum TaxID=2058175 RepID=A0A5B7X3J5_9FLAO|nr:MULTISPECIES: outer membrane beta-barrel protein [Antarcticibacterium]MCM4160111.1 hypothetical protein [Antarcticibacterium sp. W02-3]QCY69665.1 porin [Antarcticibacterium flavum]